MASLLQNDDGQSQSQAHFMRVLKFTAAAISCAGTATLQARQLLITQTAAPFGENALTQATSGLATAYSLGSVVEFFLSPTFGRLSDRFGRKPMMLFLMVGPALMRAMCALVRKPFIRIRLLTLGLNVLVAASVAMFGHPQVRFLKKKCCDKSEKRDWAWGCDGYVVYSNASIQGFTSLDLLRWLDFASARAVGNSPQLFCPTALLRSTGKKG